jgi:hypothetical protein
MNVFVIIACHFQSKNTLCSTTIARLARAVAMADSQDRFVVTGDLSYEPQGPRLGDLMRDWLLAEGIESERIHLLREGVGTFSEARRCCQYLQEAHFGIVSFTLVSSWWYFLQGKEVWQRRARERGLEPRFESVGGGGMKTVLLYSALGAAFLPCRLPRYEKWLEATMHVRQVKRRDGFRFNGCA